VTCQIIITPKLWVTHLAGLPGRGISPTHGLYLHRKTQHRNTTTNINALSGIRIHDLSNEAEKLTLRLRGHCDIILFIINIICPLVVPVCENVTYAISGSVTERRRRAQIIQRERQHDYVKGMNWFSKQCCIKTILSEHTFRDKFGMHCSVFTASHSPKHISFRDSRCILSLNQNRSLRLHDSNSKDYNITNFNLQEYLLYKYLTSDILHEWLLFVWAFMRHNSMLICDGGQ
jgi:hypothetical protein